MPPITARGRRSTGLAVALVAGFGTAASSRTGEELAADKAHLCRFNYNGSPRSVRAGDSHSDIGCTVLALGGGARMAGV